MYSLLVLVKIFSFCAYLISNSSAQKEAMKVPFSIRTFNKSSNCIPPTNLLPIDENQKIYVTAVSDVNFRHGNYTCFIGESEDSSPTEAFLTTIKQDKKIIFFGEKIFGYENDGKYLICRFEIDLGQNGGNSNPGLSKANCSVRLFVKSGAAEIKDPKLRDDNNNSTIVTISCVVGIIVILIIVAQSIALLYFKSRAQARNRLDSLVTRDRHFDRNEEVRYSAPPSRRNTKTNRATAETDSHIYEMVGVNALYKESSELDIKNRPPLPLPDESPVPLPASLDTLPRHPKSKPSSTLDLNSVSSKPVAAKPVKKELPPPPVTTMRKAPCRPPKPVDGDSLAGSLPRPTKPGTSLPRPPKTGTSLHRPPKPGNSMPKMPATDPALLELKKALEKRNVGNAASPTLSQQSTLEMQPKTPTKTQPPPTLAKPSKTPVGAVNPLAPNLKLILPKIEASLKQPPSKPLKAEVSQLRTTENGTGGLSIQPVKPGVPTFRRPSAESIASSVSAGVPLRPTQTLAKPRPLPQIQPEEDERQYSDDDEWTYERLEPFNIYNV